MKKIAVIFFLLGGATVWGIDYYVAKKLEEKRPSIAQNHRPFEHFFKDDFFNPNKDPFQELRRLRQEMNAWSDFAQREDDKYVYYELDLKGQKPKKVEVEVKDGQVSITGQVEQKREDDNNSSFFSSSFHRSFPAPGNVDGEKFQMEQEGNKIIIKFPKT